MLQNKTIDDVLKRASVYIKNEKSLQLISDAYIVAKTMHEGQFRKSKDPYIQHPLEVAYMLADLQTSPITIASGLLHDVLEDTDYPKEKLEDKFGSDIANIVDGVTKIGQLKYMTKEKALARSHQKILLAMAKDIRVVLVKLIDRVHNMRTLEFQPPHKQKRISQETLDLYAPLAHRLGMYRIKAELEDLSFRYLDEKEYEKLTKQLDTHRAAQEEDIIQMQSRLDELLQDSKVKTFEIKGRVKNIYSIHNKMRQKDLAFNEIYDLMALRILVESVEDCYRALGIVHSKFNPIPRRFKDYIAVPKPNLYQSLHTTIVGINGKVFEIQIRTYEMDEIAELGIAAHWAYKEDNKNYTPEAEQLEIAAKLKWYKDLLIYAEIGETEDSDPLETIKEDIFSANVYVFTPNGDVMDFPVGATPLDFAYKIHTEVGNKTVGAIVNNRIVPLTYKLKTGDVVEIKTSKSSAGPNDSWLKIVRTSHAKHKIRTVLNKQRKDTLIAKGREDFERALREDNIILKDFDDKVVSERFEKRNITSIEDLYFEIGKNNLSPRGAINQIRGIQEKLDDEQLIKQYSEESRRIERKSHNEFGIIVDGLDKTSVKLANCCFPIMGDNIIGYVSKGYGIVVHRLECHNVRHSNEERFIQVIWDPDFDKKVYESVFRIFSFDRRNIVAEIINIINSSAATILSISSRPNKDGDLVTTVKLAISNIEQLQSVFSNLNKVGDIYSIERVLR